VPFGVTSGSTGVGKGMTHDEIMRELREAVKAYRSHPDAAARERLEVARMTLRAYRQTEWIQAYSSRQATEKDGRSEI
jgi:hypothetical protein